jgi:hypothetical protein
LDKGRLEFAAEAFAETRQRVAIRVGLANA